ncbi:MAG: M14 family zinc carboxypeptidase [Acidobacteriota bacterium]
MQARHHKRGISTLLALLVATAPVLAAPARFLARIQPLEFDAALRQLEASGWDVAGHNRSQGYIEVVVERDGLRSLVSFGDLTLVEPSRPFREVRQATRGSGVDAADQRYKTYSEVLRIMDGIEAQHPSIAHKVDLTRALGLPPTWEGRHLFAMKISDNVTRDEDELAILFDTLHHARELNTIEVGLDIVRFLTRFYDQLPQVRSWVDSYEIWVVPVVNPDGLEYVWSTDQFWRKNRRDNQDGTFGVDLNRNYPFLWGACGSSSGDPGSDTYRGPAPLSEPEVETMVALGTRLRPIIYNSFHSSGREVLPPYVCADLAEGPLVDTVRDLYRNRMGYDWRLASSSGESFEWFYNQASSVGYLTEIGTAFQPPFEETLAELKRVRPGWMFLLDLPATGPLVQGTVTDAVSGAPVAAEISSSRVLFTEGERRASEAGFGRYGWFLQLGPHTLTFSAAGFALLSVDVSSLAGGTTLDVALQPLP